MNRKKDYISLLMYLGLFNVFLIFCIPIAKLKAQDTNLPAIEYFEKELLEIESSNIATNTKLHARENIGSILSLIKSINANKEQLSMLKEQVLKSADEISSLQKQIQLLEKGYTVVSSETYKTLSDFEQAIIKTQIELNKLKELQLAQQLNLEKINRRRIEAPQLIATLKQKIEELKEQIKKVNLDNDKYAFYLFTAKLTQANTELNLTQFEFENIDKLTELYTLRLELLNKKINNKTIELESLKKLSEEIRKKEAINALKEVEKLAEDTDDLHPSLIDFAKDNKQIAEKLQNTLVRINDINKEIASTTQLLQKLTDEHKNLKEKVKIIGFSNAIGVLLRLKKAELPSLPSLKGTLDLRSKELSEAQIEIIDIEEKLSSLSDIKDYSKRFLEKLKNDFKTNTNLTKTEQHIEKLVKSKKEFLESYKRELLRKISKLVDLDSILRQLINKRNEFATFIDERILWIKSSPTFSPVELYRIFYAIKNLFTINNIRSVIISFWIAIYSKISVSVAILLAWLLFINFRPSIANRINNISEIVKKPDQDSFIITIETIFLTILWSGLWPFLIYSIGYILQDVTSNTLPEPLLEAIASNLKIMALVIWGVEVFRQVFRPNGLAEKHCFWNIQEAHYLLRNQARLYCYITIPLAFINFILAEFNNETWQQALYRWVTIFMLLSFSAISYPILKPTGILMKIIEARIKKPLIYHIRYILFASAVLIPIILAVVCLFGYVYTANNIFLNIFYSLSWFLFTGFLYSLSWRFLFINRRKLALSKSRIFQIQKFNTLASDSTSAITPIADQTSVMGSSKFSSEPSIYELSEQTEKILYLIFVILLSIGLYKIWVEVFPAIRILEQIKLWQVENTILEKVLLLDGQEKSEWVSKIIDISLFDILLACLILFVTFKANKNFEGMLELFVYQQINIDVGLKFAINTIISYLISIIGIVWSLEILGLSWNKIQWLIAGISVGLGFGLQEIFANFISGLILLFERPIRVGDVISIGDITGQVIRIQIRSTTLKNAESKEIIIPNKDLITAKIINWTLTDSVVRFSFPVSVSYNANPEQVIDVLYNAVKNHPRVLQNPQPQIVFTGFGESALNFEVRVFIAEVTDFPVFQTQINKIIFQALKSNNIEIPYPQVDVHLKQQEKNIHLDTLNSIHNSKANNIS